MKRRARAAVVATGALALAVSMGACGSSLGGPASGVGGQGGAGGHAGATTAGSGGNGHGGGVGSVGTGGTSAGGQSGSGAAGRGGTSGGNGGSGGTPTGSGIDGSKLLVDLTPEERAQMCDWGASLFGGYGRMVSCSDGSSASSASNQAACLANSVPPGCGATVADDEACGRKVHDFCAAALSMSECDPLLSCTTSPAQPSTTSSPRARPVPSLALGISL